MRGRKLWIEHIVHTLLMNVKYIASKEFRKRNKRLAKFSGYHHNCSFA